MCLSSYNGGTWRYNTPSIYLGSLFWLEEPNLADKIGHTADPACLMYSVIRPSRHHDATMNNNSSSGRDDLVECIGQTGSTVVGDGWMPGMPGISGTSPDPSAPTGRLDEGVAPHPCPQQTPLTLSGNNRGAVRAAEARRGGGTAWQPRHVGAIADGMGSGVSSTHNNSSR